MKKLSIILLAVSLIAFSCNNDDEVLPEEGSVSFSMTYDGVSYTEAEANSLNMVGGMVAAKGTTDDGFLLTIMGIGEDGTTTEITPNVCSVILDFGAAAGKEGLVATSGTVKRTGNKIDINVSGITTSLES